MDSGMAVIYTILIAAIMVGAFITYEAWQSGNEPLMVAMSAVVLAMVLIILALRQVGDWAEPNGPDRSNRVLEALKNIDLTSITGGRRLRR